MPFSAGYNKNVTSTSPNDHFFYGIVETLILDAVEILMCPNLTITFDRSSVRALLLYYFFLCPIIGLSVICEVL